MAKIIVRKIKQTVADKKREAMLMEVSKLRSRINTLNDAIYHNKLELALLEQNKRFNYEEAVKDMKEFIKNQEELRDRLIRKLRELERLVK